MTDTTNNETPETATDAVEVTEPQGEATNDEATVDADELAEWKGHARKHESRAKALAEENKALAAQVEQAKSLSSKVSELEKALESARGEASRALLAAEVSAAKGVKLRYLTGSTREELEASADEWLADAQSLSRVGIVPTQGTGESAPRASSFHAGAERARAERTKEKA